MKRRIEGLRFALVWAAGIVFGLGFHNPSAADTWSPPSEVLFRLTSASTITRDSLGYVINSPAVAGVVQTRATGPLHAIWEAFEADTTLYWMAVVDDAARAQTIQDLQALTEIEFAEPNIYFDLDDASSPSDFYFQTDYWPYWPWNDEVAIQSVCGAVLNWTTCQHDGYDCNYPETYRPNNSPVRDQWNTTMMQADLAWLVSQGSDSVRVAILDSGVDWQHPDLGANIWNNPDEDLFGDGTIHQTGDEFSPWEFDSLDLDDLDQDENGLFNDLVGWRYHSWDSEPTLPQHDPNHGVCMIGVDPYGPGTSGYQIPHGTQMASLIGAVHNGFGCVGVCPNVSIIPVNVGLSYESTEGWKHAIGLADLIRGINYAISKHVDVINISMSVLLDDYPGDQGALEQVLGRADALGIVVCCSAGNTDAESLRWPAASEDVLACGVVRPDTTKASYSCYGAYVDFVAPGGNWEVEEYITTEYMAATKWSYPEPYWPEYLPPHTIVDESPITTGPVHTYKQTDGQTSGAAAQMSGVIALLKSRYPSYLKDDLVEELIRGAVPVDQYQLPQHQGKLGHGLLNPYRSMTEWGGPRASELQSGAVWRDSVWVSGDYTVPAGASLTIMPGTTVYVANFDNERAGDYPDVVEISGATVNAIGTPEAPIRFVTYGPAGIDTRSLVFGKRGSSEPGAVRLEHCEFADLEAFVVFGSTNAQADTTMVSNCTFVYPGSGELHYLRLGDAYLRACTFESGWTVFPYDNAHIEWCKFEHVPGESSPQPPIVFINSGRVFMANSIVRDAVVAIRTYPSPTDTLYLDDVLLEHACDPPEVDRGELGIDVQGGVVKAENLTVRGYTVGASLQGSGRFSAEYSTFTNCYQAALNNPSDNLMFFGYYVEPGSPLNKGGYNVFEDNTKNIANFHYSGTVQARLCWWGSPSGPPAKSNRGRVDTLFHLLANPNLPPPPDFLVLAEEPSPPFSVGRNYPNPFNPVTEFTISVPRGGGLVRAMVYDIRGRGVRRLLDRVLVSGEHRIEFNGKDDAGGALPSGMYLCRFNFRDREEVVKATLVK